MRFATIFTGSGKVFDAYKTIELSTSELYHYTSEDVAAKIIDDRELWVTRTDTFLDESEIEHGHQIIGDIVREHSELSTDEKQSVLELLKDYRVALRGSYVLSLTKTASCEYLAEEYGKGVIEFESGIPDVLACVCRHAVPEGDAFRLYFTDQTYETYEGTVKYTHEEKYDFAKQVVDAMIEHVRSGSPIQESSHIQSLLVLVIVLCKEESYALEQEYRIVFVANDPDMQKQFECSSDGKVYVRLLLPGGDQKLMSRKDYGS